MLVLVFTRALLAEMGDARAGIISSDFKCTMHAHTSDSAL